MENEMILKGARVLTDRFTFEETDVIVENGMIISVEKTNAPGEDIRGAFVVPGLIDIHTHGIQGFDFLDGTMEALEAMRRAYAAAGTTSVLATIMTAPKGAMTRAAKAVGGSLIPGNAKAANDSKIPKAHIRGVYLEGPFFNPEHAGAQLPEALMTPDNNFLQELIEASGNTVKIVSLAPELPGAVDLIRSENNITFFLGHTSADYDSAREAINAGARGITHTFNQMNSFHHRAPGILGAAVESDVFCECITDGLHVHPSAVRLLFSAVGCERFISITDSLRATGLPDGKYRSGGQEVIVKGGLARLSSGVIAGSTLTMLAGVRNLIRWGIRPEDAFYTASATPAKAAGIFDKTGSITPGKDADLLILNADYSLKKVIIG